MPQWPAMRPLPSNWSPGLRRPFGGVVALRDGRLHAPRRRDPWSRRRERRWQEHADEDHRRRACGILWDVSCARPRDVAFARPATRLRPASPWSIRNSASCPNSRRRERVFWHPADAIAWVWSMAAHVARSARATRAVGHRRRSARAMGSCRSAAAIIELGRVLFSGAESSFWTSRPRLCRRPRSSGSSRLCAGCARPERASFSSRISSTTCSLSATL